VKLIIKKIMRLVSFSRICKKTYGSESVKLQWILGSGLVGNGLGWSGLE